MTGDLKNQAKHNINGKYIFFLLQVIIVRPASLSHIIKDVKNISLWA